MLYKVAESSFFSLLLAKYKATRSLYVYIFCGVWLISNKEGIFPHCYTAYLLNTWLSRKMEGPLLVSSLSFFSVFCFFITYYLFRNLKQLDVVELDESIPYILR